jgi:DNA repair exonuclease SbcCD ATPase subunit
MADEKVTGLMKKYMEVKKELATLEAEKQRLIDEAMPKEVQKKVAEIEEEFAGKSEKAAESLTKYEEEIKEGVVSLQKNVAVEGLKATYHKGRVTWDGKGLEELAETNPDVGILILPHKKQGKDYASFKVE